MSQPSIFVLDILSVNIPPSFRCASAQLTKRFSAVPQTLDTIIYDISQGGWDEDDQLLTFRIDQVGGLPGLVLSIEINCMTAAGLTDPYCYSRNATLNVTMAPYAFGNLLFNVTLVDSGGTDRGGRDTATQQLSLDVLPANEVPFLTLETRQLIVSGRNNESVLIEKAGLVSSASLGHYEDASTPCPPDFSCENQTGSFELVPVDGPDVTSMMFQTLPSISWPTYLISFSLKTY